LYHPVSHRRDTQWPQFPIALRDVYSQYRLRLKTTLPMQTPESEFASELVYTFTLFDDLPHLFVDVEARYACTPKRQVIHNLTQKLRRLMEICAGRKPRHSN